MPHVRGPQLSTKANGEFPARAVGPEGVAAVNGEFQRLTTPLNQARY